MKPITLVLLCLLLTLPFNSRADEGRRNVTIDVSGHKGHNGERGEDYAERQEDRDGKDAEDGTDAGSIDVTIGFAPGSNGQDVIIKGTRKLNADDIPAQFEEHVSAAALQSIVLRANGGQGGIGGHGGAGHHGRNGENGSNATVFSWNLNGGNGGDGGQGQDGGEGGRSGVGGRGGTVNVTILKGSELLAPFISVEANPGSGGDGAQGGDAGPGGTAGTGGEAMCKDNTRPLFRSSFGCGAGYDCGCAGSNGRAGPAGHEGRSTEKGRDGRKGEAKLAYSDGSPVKGKYHLQANRWLFDEETADGVIEPKETLKVKGVELENNGSAPVPAATYSVTMADGRSVQVKVPQLAPGAKTQVLLAEPTTVQASAAGSTTIPMDLQLDALTPGTSAPAALPVQQPVAISATVDLDLTSRNREADLVYTITNNSNKSYGTGGDVNRKVALQLAARGANPPLVKMPNGEFKPLDQLSLDVANLASGESRDVKVHVKVPDGWKPGDAFDVRAALAIENSKVAPAAARPSHLAYRVDKSEKMEKNLAVTDLGLVCWYKHTIGSYAVDNVKISKPDGGKELTVTTTLHGQKESPPYSIPLDRVPARFLDSLLSEKPIDSYDTISFLQTLSLPPSAKTSWNITECGINSKAAKRQDVDSALRAAANINSLNELSALSSGIVEDHGAPSKRVPASPAMIGNHVEQASPSEAWDAK
jgi:hypothetical protein